VVTNHRERSAFNLTPYQGDELKPVHSYTYDNEKLTPYSFEAELDDNNMGVKYALSHQSAIYNIEFRQADKPVYVMVNTRMGAIHADAKGISGHQRLSDNTNIYLYIEPEQSPIETGILADGKLAGNQTDAEGRNACAVWRFADGTKLNINPVYVKEPDNPFKPSQPDDETPAKEPEKEKVVKLPLPKPPVTISPLQPNRYDLLKKQLVSPAYVRRGVTFENESDTQARATVFQPTTREQTNEAETSATSGSLFDL
jgi:hypothetical protein